MSDCSWEKGYPKAEIYEKNNIVKKMSKIQAK